ncbi:MAG: DUF3560 domain-containing protein [Flavobacterium sp.]|nr:DUF3560 domain-containing protein [Flavobacterium sp.]
MNTYAKYTANVFVAKCEEKHEKGTLIDVITKHGKENQCVIFNLVYEKDGFYYYSIVRADGFNYKEYALKKAERYQLWADARQKKANDYYQASQEGKDFLVLAEPIKIGHHSEKRHRGLIEKNWNRMGKSVENMEKAGEHESKAEYWKERAEIINLSMPESVEYFEYKYEEVKEYHEGLKSGKYERLHSYSLTYAKKEVNEIFKKLELARKLWS